MGGRNNKLKDQKGLDQKESGPKIIRIVAWYFNLIKLTGFPMLSKHSYYYFLFLLHVYKASQPMLLRWFKCTDFQQYLIEDDITINS